MLFQKFKKYKAFKKTIVNQTKCVFRATAKLHTLQSSERSDIWFKGKKLLFGDPLTCTDAARESAMSFLQQ